MVTESADINVEYLPELFRYSHVNGTGDQPWKPFAPSVGKSRRALTATRAVRAMAASTPAPPSPGVRAGAGAAPRPENEKIRLYAGPPECPEQVPVHDLVCRVELRLQVCRHLHPRHRHAGIANVPGVRCRLDQLAYGILHPAGGCVVATLVPALCNCVMSADGKSSAIA